MTTDHKSDAIANAIQATPSLAAIGYWLAGKDITFWGGVCGIVFIVTQWAYVMWKWRRDIRRDELNIRAGGTDDE